MACIFGKKNKFQMRIQGLVCDKYFGVVLAWTGNSNIYRIVN